MTKEKKLRCVIQFPNCIIVQTNYKFLDKYFDQQFVLESEQKEEFGLKFKPNNLKIKGYNYVITYNETSDDDYDDCKEKINYNKVIVIMEQSMLVIRDPKNVCFNLDQPKDIDENLKHQIESL